MVGGGARGCIQRENTWMNAEAKEKKRQEKWKNPIFKKGSRFATIDPSAGLCVCVRVRRRKPDPDRRTPSDWIPVLSSQPSRSPSLFFGPLPCVFWPQCTWNCKSELGRMSVKVFFSELSTGRNESNWARIEKKRFYSIFIVFSKRSCQNVAMSA